MIAPASTPASPSSFHKVLQRQRTDCGVACLAMIAGTSYEAALEAFTKAGLHLYRQRKRPLTSNFKELTAAAAHLGLALHRRAFESWPHIQSPTILKVSGGRAGRKGNWHWVVAHRTPTGVEIQDPGTDLPSYENPPVEGCYIDFASYQPTGHILALEA
jgi:ABC-type bacteriocin/lantibiotic exporter with double-glycine peptidase domain